MEITFKNFLKENSIDVSKLPAGLQAKIKKFDETYKKFTEASEDEQKKEEQRIKKLDQILFKEIEKEAIVETEEEEEEEEGAPGATSTKTPPVKKADKSKTETKEESGGNGILWFFGIALTVVGLGVLAKKLNDN